MRTARIPSIAFVFLIAASVGAEEFRSDPGHFRVEIPEGYVRFNANRLAKVKAVGEKLPKELIHDGFDRPNGFGGDGLPFILIHEVRERLVVFSTHDQVHRALESEFRKRFEQTGSAKIGSVTYDRTKSRFSAPIELRLPNGNKATGVLYGFLGKDSVVLIQCIGARGDLPQHMPAFDRMADTFRYDDGFQFVALDSTKLMWIAVAAVLGLGCVATLVVICIIAVVLLVKSIQGTRSSPPPNFFSRSLA